MKKIDPKKQYRRISSGDILSGEQVLFQLEMIKNPALKPALLLDLEEVKESRREYSNP